MSTMANEVDINHCDKMHKNNIDLNKINSIKSKENGDHNIVAHFNKEEESFQVKFKGLEDGDSICSDVSDNGRLPPIPDGGWGWVVVVSAFIVSACADGLAFSFGLLHDEFTDYFKTTQSKTSLIGSLFLATPLLAGPIMSALVDKYGCRVMTIIAGIMSTVGFILASLSNSVEMLCLTFGFMTGLAMGILYVTAVVSVAFWFDKRRNLAVSLASCGIGFGTLIYSPMTHYFLEVYDWRNTIILLAGTLLNMCVCGTLMRNPDWLEIKQKRERRLSKARSRKSSSAGSISSKSLGGESLFLSAEELRTLLKSGQSPEYILDTLVSSIAEAEKLEATTQMNAVPITRMHSSIHLPTFVQQHEEVPAEVIDKLISNKRLYNIILENYPDILNTRRRSEENLKNESSGPGIEPASLAMKIKVKKPKKTSESESIRNSFKIKLDVVQEETTDLQKDKCHNNASRQDSKNTQSRKNDNPSRDARSKTPQKSDWFSKQITRDHHYFKDMPLYRNTIVHRGVMMNIPRYKLRAASLPNIYKNDTWSLSTMSDDEMNCCGRFWIIIKKMFDFRMFTEFHFLMFNISSLILSIWCIIPYFFLNSFMKSQNVEGGPTMIIIIGVFSSIGIVALGWAGDQPWINVTKTYAVCLIICGVSVACYPPFITNYWALAVISAVFGLSFASSYSYTPAILMELMPIDHFTVAYGLILLSQGIGHLGGPPLAGMFYDITGTWDLTFYTSGAWLIVSGLFVGAIAYTKDVRLCGARPLLKELEEEERKAESEEA